MESLCVQGATWPSLPSVYIKIALILGSALIYAVFPERASSAFHSNLPAAETIIQITTTLSAH